ncbi:MAG: DUF4465 domain-containing protein [Deltaproteobacteria bacterium]|nr:DUF4465 domain-containing protein [Candidatus Anaeroferrophillacea bacterium]
MKRFTLKIACAMALLLLLTPSLYAATATFDDFALAPESHYGGAGSGATGFSDGGAFFEHNSSDWAWNGWSYSNHTDTTTAGYTNQFSAITGGGAGGTANYAVAYVPTDWAGGSYASLPISIMLDDTSGSSLSGMYITNTTYAYLSMTGGDQFGKTFGGDTGNDADWFKMTYQGIRSDGSLTAAYDFYLADYRFADNSQDYIIDDWTWLNLSGLGNGLKGIQFTMASSDTGDWGMNTPAYFAIDNFNGSPVPIPGAVWLLGSGLAGLVGLRRRRF